MVTEVVTNYVLYLVCNDGTMEANRNSITFIPLEIPYFVSIGVDRISSSEDDVSSVSSDEGSPPGSPPPEDSRCKLPK